MNSGDELDALLGGGSGKKSNRAAVSSGAPSRSSKGGPSRAEIRSVMGKVASRASVCSKFSTGTVQLKITISSNGNVMNARTVGAFANTATGNCVEKAARKARFPRFKGRFHTFTYPVRVR